MKKIAKSKYAAVPRLAARLRAQLLIEVWLMTGICLGLTPAQAQETVCARVKIEIKQELTLERQAFDAEMKINNTTDSGVIENISVVVKVTDENGEPVSITDDPSNLSAKFFIRLSGKENISAIDGTGTVNPKTTAAINWLLIPAPGSAGTSPLGKKYLVGATLKYRFGSEDTVLEISPDVITVKPLPLLTLDYFLPKNVWADDPLTPEIEATEPFTLGVRVKNNGQAAAKNLKIDSAQPKIVENNQGLLINFLLTGSYVDDAPTQNTLLINFGDIAPTKSKMGRWNMETTLAGRFTEFSAKFTHADELGGALTSILQATNAHFLLRDVRVDLPGRDAVRDFLAQDGDVIRVYESDSTDTEVTDRSTAATLQPSVDGRYRLSFAPTAGFVYLKIPDPFRGEKAVGNFMRSDAKAVLPENVWFWKARNETTKQLEYWFSLFDVNSTGVYESDFPAPVPGAHAPVVAFVPDRLVVETQQVSFVVDASSPDGKALTFSAAPLPAGATFTVQPPSDEVPPGSVRAIFDWTPAKGMAGTYLINYSASDGELNTSRAARIKVEAASSQPGPTTPAINAPLSGAQVDTLRPTLSVDTSADPADTTTHVSFELYADEAATSLAASVLLDRAALGTPTSWAVPNDLSDNTSYWWRARTFDGVLYSPWVNARFFVNTFNDAPESFNLAQPVPNAEVASLTPEFSWSNSSDKDGDVITYDVTLYTDAALSEVFTQATGLAQDASGTTRWTTPLPLANHVTYYWRVVAKDALGAQTVTAARLFTVNIGNAAPTAPVILSPAAGSQSTQLNTVLSVQNSTDADGDLLTYVFEIDTVNTFDSPDKKTSGQVIQNASGSTSWTTPELIENKHYWWRVKAQDGKAESVWVGSDFLVNVTNEAPPMPTVKNPGTGSWTATQTPSLEANPVLDPETQAVRYQFEVYRDADLTQKVADGTSTNTAFITPTLQDKTTHWWRVRALDASDAASAWSAAAVLYVSTGPFVNPTIAVPTPATNVMPTTVNTPNGARKQLTIAWEGTDPNIEPTIALYSSSSKTGFAGTLIVDGLRQGAGTHTGNYVWDVTDLAPGAYYVYAVIYDAKGMGRAYAPGALVIPKPAPAGRVVGPGPGTLHTSEDGGTDTFQIRLSRAPKSNVVLPVSSSNQRAGVARPARLVFTAANWNQLQEVTVTGQNNCLPDARQEYEVSVGPAQSLDPDYMGVPGKTFNAANARNPDYANSTNNPQVHICPPTVVSERRVGQLWEYRLRAELTNAGVSVSGITATLRQLPAALRNSQVLSNTLTFGAVAEGDTAKPSGVVVLRSPTQIPADRFRFGSGFKWNVVVLP